MPTVTINLSEFTFVSSAKLNSNFLVYPMVCVGNDHSLKKCTTLINVALPDLPKKVDSAILQLSVIMKNGSAPSKIAICQLGAEFDASAVTYNTMPALISTGTQFSVSTKDLYVSIHADVTDVVNAWLSGTAVNHGIALTSSDGTIVQFGTNNIGYEPYFPVLTITYSSISESPTDQSYGYLYNTDNQSVDEGKPILFTDNGPMNEMTHDAGTDSVGISSAGLYAVWYQVTGTSENQFAVFQNDALLPESVSGISSTNTSGMTMVNAVAGDTITLRNHTGSGTVTLNSTERESGTGTSASMILLKVGPSVVPDPLLADVNDAITPDAMKSAITNPDLGLDLSAFKKLTPNQQKNVFSGLLFNRPTLGYLSASNVKMMLNYEVNLAAHAEESDKITGKEDEVDSNGGATDPKGDVQSEKGIVHPGGADVEEDIGVYSGSYDIQKLRDDNHSALVVNHRQSKS